MVRTLLRRLADEPIAVRLSRFVVVGAVAAGVQMLLLWLFVEQGRVNYLVAAAIAIEITIVFQYVLNNSWTFQASQNTGRTSFLSGLVKTNLVRGSAIPIQLGILYGLVTWRGVPYLLANAVAIVLSGIYRYVLDSRWTWAD
ncbi:polysaccharide biosynthesis protein GtrA [Haloprofundus marisrubri]|uniref:Polysaccharide biosynthesis protein GtrA n=1 Tax=Haloprofundus marisrubri TaxID=1514971 RepID=A0A0W1RBV0_9EURY|nr:GtrA family protein [Haloprofundus marisrubri]KTG10597.1 polysaccharide biosynthesis protein GtrA [Haloprofundus marisrubri]